jgi:hypothetical protein
MNYAKASYEVIHNSSDGYGAWIILSKALIGELWEDLS